MTQESIVSRVQKLLRLATSSNAHEAALAASKAQELIDAHNLSDAILSEQAGHVDDEPVRAFESPLDATPRVDRWRGQLALCLAHANGCQVYQHGTLRIIGRPSDAETVRYLYSWLVAETQRLVDTSGAGEGRTWRNNFRLGVVETIARKLTAQREAFVQAARRTAESSTALVVVNNALTRIDQRKMDAIRFGRVHLKLRSGSAQRTHYDGNARQAGRKAGESINLSSRGSLTSGQKRIGS